jgi:hypothetical protein
VAWCFRYLRVPQWEECRGKKVKTLGGTNRAEKAKARAKPNESHASRPVVLGGVESRRVVREFRAKLTMATKKYLRKRLDGTEDWVADPNDATADYRQPIEVTQVRLAIMGVRGTTLVEVPDTHQMQAKFIICREEQNRPA